MATTDFLAEVNPCADRLVFNELNMVVIDVLFGEWVSGGESASRLLSFRGMNQVVDLSEFKQQASDCLLCFRDKRQSRYPLPGQPKQWRKGNLAKLCSHYLLSSFVFSFFFSFFFFFCFCLQ